MYEEVVRILEYIQMHATVEDQDGTVHNANIIWGTSEKPQLGNAIELVVVATGFDNDDEEHGMSPVPPRRTAQTGLPPASHAFPGPSGIGHACPYMSCAACRPSGRAGPAESLLREAFLLQFRTLGNAGGCAAASWEGRAGGFLQSCGMVCRRYGFCLSLAADFF